MTEEIKTTSKTNNKVAIGLDVGTMNLISSRSDNSDVSLMRNVFLKIDPDETDISDMSNMSYVENDGDIFIVGQNAFELANIFGKEVSRPMQHGLISSKEIDAIDVLTLMIKSLIGEIKGKDAYCSYSVPAQAIDDNRSVIYHEKVFGRILSSLGITHKPINEAMAIIYSECAKENFSGIALSFGAGMCNCAISYRGIEALTFSTARSGDWVDTGVANDLNMVPNRVTSVKEKLLDLEVGFGKEKNKKKRKILEALEYYYGSLIEYTIKKIIKEFEDKVDIEIDDELPIVISGGTSLPNGFDKLFEDMLNKYELPFDISEVRRASNPLHAVSNGLLIKTQSDIS